MKRTCTCTWIALPLLLLLPLLACGHAPDGSDDGGGFDLTSIPPNSDLTTFVPPSPAEACAKVQTAVTNLVADCFGYDRAWYAPFADTNRTCASQAASVTAGRQTYHGDALAACLDAYGRMTCSEYFDGGWQQCQVFVGTVAGGGECRHVFDCADGYCQSVSTGCPSTCKSYVAKGAACSPTDNCAPGTACVAGTCAAPAYGTVGDACGAGKRPCNFFTAYCDSQKGVCVAKQTSGACKGYECAYGYQCAGASGSRTCQPAKHLGAACTVNYNECSLPESSCSLSTHTCSVRSSGQSCGYIDGKSNEYAFCAGSWCKVPMAQDVGTCQPLLADGSACTGPGCAPLSLCIANKCQPYVCQ